MGRVRERAAALEQAIARDDRDAFFEAVDGLRESAENLAFSAYAVDATA